MKPEHFIYKSDGLYYMQNVPEKPTNINYFDCSGPDGIKRHFEKGGDFGFEKGLKRYNEALERAKADAVKCDESLYEYFYGQHERRVASCLSYSFNGKLGYRGMLIENEIYTIIMEEKIEIYDMELKSCEYCQNCKLIPACTTLAARIAAPKKEEESEDEFTTYIRELYYQSFEGWNTHSMNGYITALKSVYEKYIEIKRKPL